MTNTGIKDLILSFLGTKNSATLLEVIDTLKNDGYNGKQVKDSLRGLKLRGHVQEPVKGRFAIVKEAAAPAPAPMPKATKAPAQKAASMVVEHAPTDTTPPTVVRDAIQKMRGQRVRTAKPRAEMTHEERQVAGIAQNPKTKVSLNADQIQEILELLLAKEGSDVQTIRSLKTGLEHCAKLRARKESFHPASTAAVNA
jgi:hypothetical protein